MTASQSLRSFFKLGRGPGWASLPPLALRFLSGPAYRLLEILRQLPPGREGDTTYDQIMALSGIRSRASIAKALKELAALGVIDYQVHRDGGRVLGLKLTYNGLPFETPEAACALFDREVARRIDRLVVLQKEISAGDREPGFVQE